MARKLTYEELEQRVTELEREAIERKQAEEALRESEERFRTLVENVPVAVYRTIPGPKGKYLMANPTLLKMFGLDSEEELKKITVADVFMNPEHRKAFWSPPVKEAVKRGLEEAIEESISLRDAHKSMSALLAGDEKWAGAISHYRQALRY